MCALRGYSDIVLKQLTTIYWEFIVRLEKLEIQVDPIKFLVILIFILSLDRALRLALNLYGMIVAFAVTRCCSK